MMTKEEIIEITRQADIKYRTDVFYSQFCDGVYEDDLKAFAKLVAEKEREACADMIKDYENIDWNIWDCAKAIRERGQE